MTARIEFFAQYFFAKTSAGIGSAWPSILLKFLINKSPHSFIAMTGKTCIIVMSNREDEIMLQPLKLLLAVAIVAGVAAVPAVSQAESSKSESVSGTKKTQASDDFEENRRAHMQKSKENNANKGEK